MLPENNEWFSGSGEKISFESLVSIVQEYILGGARVFIGTDSFITKSKINFASAICLHGGIFGNRYFFIREYESLNKFKALIARITEEVRRTIELADLLYTKGRFSPDIIEIHIDISPFGKAAPTSKFSEMLQGYVQGAGYDCKVKPDAWASQTVADRHSK